MANFSKGLTGNFQERASAIKDKGLELRNNPNLLQTLAGSYGLSQTNTNEISKIKRESALRQKKIAGGYTALDPNTYKFVKGKIKTAVTPKTPIPNSKNTIIKDIRDGHYERFNKLPLKEREGIVNSILRQEQTGQNLGLGKLKNISMKKLDNIIRKDRLISKARNIVNVGAKPANPITQKKLRAPMSVAWKPNMKINHPDANNFNVGGGTNGPTTITYKTPSPEEK